MDLELVLTMFLMNIIVRKYIEDTINLQLNYQNNQHYCLTNNIAYYYRIIVRYLYKYLFPQKDMLQNEL